MNTENYIKIIPVETSEKEFVVLDSKGARRDCLDADYVGEILEPALWPFLKSALKNRKRITIKIVVGE